MIEALRELITGAGPFYLALGGFLIGAVFGYIVFRTNFCAMGSISDIMNFGDHRRFRAWLLAGAVAILGANLLALLGVVDLGKAMYLNPTFNWLGNIIGGLMFGFGMVLAGGCTSRNLVRVGSGDVRSFVVLLMVGLFAYMTIGGILAPARDYLQRMTAVDLGEIGSQSAGDVLGAVTGLDAGMLTWLVLAILVTGLLVYCFKDESFRSSPANIVAGVGIGLCIILGWALTGLAYDEFADQPTNPISLTYVRPTGDTWEYLERFTADVVPGFGVASVIGALLGAFIGALMSGKFHFAGFADSADTFRNIVGGALMGSGGVIALGCTIGQGVTGFSTLALGSMIALVAIILGGVAGVKYMERVMMG